MKKSILKSKKFQEDQQSQSQTESFNKQSSLKRKGQKKVQQTLKNEQSRKEKINQGTQKKKITIKKHQSKPIKKSQKFEDQYKKSDQDQTQDVKVSTLKDSSQEKKKVQQSFEDTRQIRSSNKKVSKPKSTSHSNKKTQQKINLLKQKQRKANQIIQSINQAYEKDIKLYDGKKTADKKLKCIIDIKQKLKDVYIANQFMKENGVVLFIKWLRINQQNGQQTCLTVRNLVLQLILDLNLSKANIIEAELLQKQIKKYRRSRFSSLRNFSDRILQKWRNVKALPNKN